MYLAYIDESVGPASYSLGCIIFPASQWLGILDGLIEFRRFLKSRFNIPVRAELKANFLIRNGGMLRAIHLSESARKAIYRMHLRLVEKLGASAFAIVIDRDKLSRKDAALIPQDVAWEFLLQRIERFSTKNSKNILIIHDEGDGGAIRRYVRKARRMGTAGSAFGTSSLKVPARMIVEDPVARKSHESYMIQLADLCAYAAFRRIFKPSPSIEKVVTQHMWDELAGARLREVNKLVGGAEGIVYWPR